MTGTDRAAWVRRPERGSALPAGLLLRLLLRGRAGEALARALLPPIALYYALADREVRAASRGYLARVLPRRPGTADVWRHCHGFAAGVLDRALLLGGEAGRYRFDVENEAALHGATRRGGAILLGAHCGSFEALRAVGARHGVVARALMYRANHGPATRLLEALAPDLAARVIDIGTPDAMLRVRESLARGELVGMLADRTPAGERAVPVPFLGADAAFPTGPLLVAAVTGAPVVLFSAVAVGRRHYRVRFDPLADRVVLRRSDRQGDLRGWVAAYAAWLEALCRAHPYAWFNFHDFWAANRQDAPAA